MSREHWDPVDREVDHPLLGRRVHVRLSDSDCEPAVVTGVLIKLTGGGDVDVREDDGKMCYAWPALEITEAAPR